MKRVTVRELRQRMVKALSPQITDSTAVASGDLVAVDSPHACKQRLRYSAVENDIMCISCSDLVIFVLYLSN